MLIQNRNEQETSDFLRCGGTASEMPMASGTSAPTSLAFLMANRLTFFDYPEPVRQGSLGQRFDEPHPEGASVRESFFKELAADYASLKADPVAWQAELDQEEAWDASVDEGLAGE